MQSEAPPVEAVEVKQMYQPYKVFKTRVEAEQDIKENGGFISPNGPDSDPKTKFFVLYIPVKK